jgi:hypothetical protein
MQMMAMLTNSRNFSTRTEAAKATRVVVPPRFEKRGSPTSRDLLVEKFLWSSTDRVDITREEDDNLGDSDRPTL